MWQDAEAPEKSFIIFFLKETDIYFEVYFT